MLFASVPLWGIIEGMRKIAVILSKGGTAKTTTAVHLSAALAYVGRSVLLVDTDSQGHITKYLGVEPDASILDVVNGRSADPAQARPNLDVIAGGPAVIGVKDEIQRRKMRPEHLLNDKLSPIASRYDYMIIDCPPSFDDLTYNILFAVDEILAPVTLEPAALFGLVSFVEMLTPIQEYSSVKIRYVLPVIYDRRTKQAGEVLEQLQGRFGRLVCDPIRADVRISEAPGHGQTIFEYAPTSRSAEDYTTLAQRVLNDE